MPIAAAHGQNSHVQLKYIQKNGLRSRFAAHFNAATAAESARHHLQMSRGVNWARDDFRVSKEKALSRFSQSKSACGGEVEYEHFSQRRGRVSFESQEAELQVDRLKELRGNEGEQVEEVFREKVLRGTCLLKGLREIKWVFREKVELKGATFEQSNEADDSIVYLWNNFERQR